MKQEMVNSLTQEQLAVPNEQSGHTETPVVAPSKNDAALIGSPRFLKMMDNHLKTTGMNRKERRQYIAVKGWLYNG